LPFEISPSYRPGKIKKNSLRLRQKRISEIVGNTKFGNIDNLLSQGQDMDYIVGQLHFQIEPRVPFQGIQPGCPLKV